MSTPGSIPIFSSLIGVDTVFNNLPEQLEWFLSDPQGSLSGGFTYSNGYLEECQQQIINCYEFSDDPTKPFEIIRFEVVPILLSTSQF